LSTVFFKLYVFLLKIVIVLGKINGRFCSVPAKQRKKKNIIKGFAMDEDMAKMLKVGVKIEGSISKFIRAAIEKYFE